MGQAGSCCPSSRGAGALGQRDGVAWHGYMQVLAVPSVARLGQLRCQPSGKQGAMTLPGTSPCFSILEGFRFLCGSHSF